MSSTILVQVQDALWAGAAPGAAELFNDKLCLDKLRGARFDLLLRDAIYWPAQLLQQLLDLPAVELNPLSCAAHLL